MRGKTNWPLLFFNGGFQGWILTLPLYGPVLFSYASHKAVDPLPLISIFLGFYALSFVLCGALLSKKQPSTVILQKLVALDLSACFCLGVSLLWVPTNIWYVLFALFGVLGPLPFLLWIAAVAQKVETNRQGWMFGITGFFIHVVIYATILITKQFHPVTAVVLVNILLFVPLFVLSRNRQLFSFEKLDQVSKGKSWRDSWMLFPLLLIIYLVGGLMYQVVGPYLAQLENSEYFERLPYIAAMPFVGLLADRLGSRAVVLLGIVGLGIGYTFFAFTSSWQGAITGSTFINIGFAFLDVFVLFVLAQKLPQKQSMLFFGLGLGTNVSSIVIGTWLSKMIVPYSQGNLVVAYSGAILILFLSLLFLEWMGQKEKKDQAHYDSLDEELLLAHQVQRSMLPRLETMPPHLEIFATIELAKEVGGDFYDVISLDESRTLFVIGDVMGKGLPAAMIMSSVVGLIRAEVHYGRPLTDMLGQVNRILLKDTQFSMFVTMGLAVIDTKKKTLTFANAGHLFPYVIQEGAITQIEQGSLPVGIDADVEYEEQTISFCGDNMLMLYTDGLVEVQNGKTDLYGFNRLEAYLRKNFVEHMGKLDGEKLLADARAFSKNGGFTDDVTLVLVRITETSRDVRSL